MRTVSTGAVSLVCVIGWPGDHDSMTLRDPPLVVSCVLGSENHEWHLCGQSGYPTSSPNLATRCSRPGIGVPIGNTFAGDPFSIRMSVYVIRGRRKLIRVRDGA